MPHDQPGAILAAELAQCLIEFNQRLADELHPAVSAGQGVQNSLVKNKNTMQLAAGFEGHHEGCVVCHA